MNIFSQKNIKDITKYTDIVFSGIILVSILALTVFSFRMVGELTIQSIMPGVENIIHNIAYIVVLLKAYKIMVFYFRYQNLSIKYLVQIAIIAPAIEVIFAINEQTLWINILYAAFSLANLLIYIITTKSSIP
jgi:hypothetical protein